jgi:hypothetical protein
MPRLPLDTAFFRAVELGFIWHLFNTATSTCCVAAEKDVSCNRLLSPLP